MRIYLALLLAAASLPAAAGNVTIRRDVWGVPHIEADSPADAAFGIGYAQAEDRLEDIYTNIRTAVGSMAEAFGPQFAEQDYIMRLSGNAERCEAYWKTAPAHILALGDNFMRGVRQYVDEHPERKPEFATELHGYMTFAIQRAMILKWPLEALKNELSRKAKAPPFASNSFAIAPARSADGSAILMTDPHLEWEGMAVFHEARVHAGEYEQCGFWLVGSPLPVLGHTGRVAWACTTGGPDTADVYMLKLNPQNPLQYEYNGEWLTFEQRLFSIPVKGRQPLQKPALYAIHGPVIAEPDFKNGVAFAGASPYFEADQLFEQSYRMITARNTAEFYDAVSMLQLMEQNIIFADIEGNIQYVRNGRTPIRPDGHNWSVPVPGNTDATRWLGIHDIADLVQVKNPPQGYFQNCNISPQNMMKDSPMTPDKYRNYLYNVTWDFQTPRGARMRQLLDDDGSVTKEEALAYTVDIYDILAKPWQAALSAAVESGGGKRMKDADFAEAVQIIAAWDGQFSLESTAAPIVRYWRLKAEKAVPVADIGAGKPLKAADQAKLLDCLAEAVSEIKSKYGRIGIAWGEIHFVGRGGKYFPSPGAEFGNGGQMVRTETVFDIEGREEPGKPGKYIGRNGSSSLMVSFLRPEGIESYSLLNWGQSGDPNSEHYVDQAEKLYGSRTFKPTWFKKEDLLPNVRSEKVLNTD